jgi:hypothetical protein
MLYYIKMYRSFPFASDKCRVSMKNDVFKCHNVDGMVVLQNYMDILKSEPGPCTGTCQMSSDEGKQFVGIKVEEVADMREEEDPEPTTSPLIKTESAVSCLCVCVSCLAHCTDIQNFLSFSVFLSA